MCDELNLDNEYSVLFQRRLLGMHIKTRGYICLPSKMHSVLGQDLSKLIVLVRNIPGDCEIE